MAGARDIRAGGAFVEISARNGAFMRGLSQAQGTLRAFAGSCQSIGASLLAVSGAALAPLGMAASAFAGFDDAMRSVAAVTGATGDQFEALTARARELGASTRYTAQDAAGAMLALGRAGMSAQQIDAATQSVLALATATGTDLAQSADIMSNTLNMFGMGADRASDAADLLTATANGSAQTLTDLFESLRMVGPQAKAAGYDLAETSAALGVLANVGLKGSMAGTALKRALQQFADPGTRQKLAEYKVAVTDINGEMRALPAIFRDLAIAMNGMPGAEKLALAKDIFDVRASGAGLNLAANVDALDAFLAKLRDVQGAAAKTETQMNAGIGGALAALKSAAQDVALSVGDALAPALQKLADEWRGNLNAISEWVARNKEVIVAAATGAAAIAVLGGAMFALGTATKAVSAAFALLQGLWVALKFIPVAATWVANFAVGLKGLAVAMWSARAAAVPLLASFAAIAAAVGVAAVALRLWAGASYKAKTAADEALKTGDARRQQDREQVARLKELAAKERLNADEQREAKTIAASLSATYGDLGAAIDKTTGKLTLQAGAFDKIAERMRKAEIEQVSAQIRELEGNYKRLSQYIGSNAQGLDNAWSWITSGFDSQVMVDAMAKSDDELRVMLADLDAARARLAALKEDAAAAKEAASGASPSSRVATRLEETQAVKDAREELEKLDEEIRQEGLTSLEKEIEAIQRSADAYVKAAQAMIDFEEAQDDAFYDAEKVAELEEKIAARRIKAEQDVAAAKAKAAAAGTTALAELESAAGDIEAARSRRAEDKRLDELSRVDGAGYMRELSRLIDAAKSGAADAAEKYRLAVSGAMEDGLMTDEERSAIADLLDAYRAAEAEVDRFADRIDRASTAAGRSAASVKLGAAGTFYAAAAAGMADRYEIRIADATEKAAKVVRDILDEIRGGAGEIRFA